MDISPFPERPDDDKLFKWKLEAFYFPHSWQKSGISGLEEIASPLQNNTHGEKDLLKLADHIAGATHRLRAPHGSSSQNPIFIHPLSAEKYPLALQNQKLQAPDWTLNSLSPKEKFFYVWLYLTLDVKQKNPSLPFELIPADSAEYKCYRTS